MLFYRTEFISYERTVSELTFTHCEENGPINIFPLQQNPKEIDASVIIWINSRQDRDHWRALVNVVLNLQVT